MKCLIVNTVATAAASNTQVHKIFSKMIVSPNRVTGGGGVVFLMLCLARLLVCDDIMCHVKTYALLQFCFRAKFELKIQKLFLPLSKDSSNKKSFHGQKR